VVSPIRDIDNMQDIQHAMSDMWQAYKKYRRGLPKNKEFVLDMIYRLVEEFEKPISNEYSTKERG